MPESDSFPTLLGQLVGALIATLLVSRILLLWIPRQEGRYTGAAVLSFMACFVLSALGHADGGDPNWSTGWVYLMPQAIWLGVDVIRLEGRRGPGREKADQAIAPASRAAEPSAGELAFWESISKSSDPKDFTAYLAQFPQGYFRALAENRLSALNSIER